MNPLVTRRVCFSMSTKDSFKTIRDKSKLSKHLRKIKNDIQGEYLIKDILDSFDLLGYNLKSEYIYSYTHSRGWGWKTTNYHIAETKKWNPFEKIYENEYAYYDLKEHILQHCFPLELKNHKSKSKENKHYIGSDICGSGLKELSDILIIDIDNHNNNSQLCYEQYQIIKNHFDNQIIINEITTHIGIHSFIKLDKPYTLEYKKQYIADLKQKENLSCVDISYNKIRFPLSYHYQPVDEELTFIDSFKSIYTIKRKYNELKGFTLSRVKEIISVPIIKKEKTESMYSRKSNTRHITPDEFIQNPVYKGEIIFISAGNRNIPMLKITQISNFNNWSIQDTLRVIRALDQGSKDLAQWTDDKLYKKIESLKNACKITYSEFLSTGKPESFISNEHLIPIEIKNVFQSKKIIKKIIHETKYKQSKLNFLKFKEVLVETIGKFYYEANNPRILKEGQDSRLLIGIQFPKPYCDLLKQHIEETKKITINVYSIIHDIMQKSNLFKQYFSNNRGFYNDKYGKTEKNFCRQYDFILNKTNKIFNNPLLISYYIIRQLKQLFNKNILLIIQDFFNKILQEIKQLNSIDDKQCIEDCGFT